MQRWLEIGLIITLVVLLGQKVWPVIKPSSASNDLPPLIAHAGGDYNGVIYTNSLEALSQSIEEKYTLIEMDVIQTTDGELVMFHDWDLEFYNLYERSPKQLTLAEFKQLDRYQHLTLDKFMSWLKEHPDVRILIDPKKTADQILEKIISDYPDDIDSLIVGTFEFDQFIRAKKQGYPHIALFLYKNSNTSDEVFKFASEHKPSLITVPSWAGYDALTSKLAKETNIPTYLHTINELDVFQQALQAGHHGVITDNLTPQDIQDAH